MDARRPPRGRSEDRVVDMSRNVRLYRTFRDVPQAGQVLAVVYLVAPSTALASRRVRIEGDAIRPERSTLPAGHSAADDPARDSCRHCRAAGVLRILEDRTRLGDRARHPVVVRALPDRLSRLLRGCRRRTVDAPGSSRRVRHGSGVHADRALRARRCRRQRRDRVGDRRCDCRHPSGRQRDHRDVAWDRGSRLLQPVGGSRRGCEKRGAPRRPTRSRGAVRGVAFVAGR